MKTPISTAPNIHINCTLVWIKQLESSKSATIEKSGLIESDLLIEFNRTSKSFEFSLNYQSQFNLHSDLDLGPYNHDVLLNIDNKRYIASRVFFSMHSPSTFSGSIDEIYTETYSKAEKYFFRMVIPLERELNFRYQLQEQRFKTDLGYVARTGSNCTISEDDLIIAVVRDVDKNYFLSIESNIAQDFESFSDKAFAVRNALAYLSGYYAGDSCYCFTYSTIEMKKPQHLHFLSIRSTMRSFYEPINSNPFSRLYENDAIAVRWYESNRLRPLSFSEFSRLGELIYKNQEFASAIILILESSIASLLFRPGGYAIALESLVPIILTEKKRTLAPVGDKYLWKKIRKELLQTIQKYKDSNSGFAYQVLENKINNLNAPTNKSKLKAPFDSLNIVLLPKDLEILETRNDFLHGRAPDLTREGKSRTTARLNLDLHYSALRLFTLLNMLIMKYVGFDGYILNYPKIKEESTGIYLNEDPYRKV